MAGKYDHRFINYKNSSNYHSCKNAYLKPHNLPENNIKKNNGTPKTRGKIPDGRKGVIYSLFWEGISNRIIDTRSYIYGFFCFLFSG